MPKFYVTLHLEIEADNVDEAREIGYHVLENGEEHAALQVSDEATILNSKVEVDEA